MITCEAILGHVNEHGLFRPRWIRRSSAILFVAAVLLAAFPASGIESPKVKQVDQGSAGALHLPPVPHLETTPWLDWAPILNGRKIDPLLFPRTPFDERACEDFGHPRAAPQVS